MNRITLKENAKQQISGNLGILLIIHIIVYAIIGISGIIPAIGPILCTVLSILLEFALVTIFLALARGTVPEVSDLFGIFKNANLCGNVIILGLLTMVYTFLWSLLLIIPGIIKALSYSMAPYILAENDYYISPSDALRESEKIMTGHKMDLFVLSLSFLGWFLLGSITCGIAYIYVMPYYQATLVNFYNEIKDKPQTVEIID